jgi:2-polyprenyl-3-methyl-5-hydroxy-6-metoxy-1,4-benzoquinol methylase
MTPPNVADSKKLELAVAAQECQQYRESKVGAPDEIKRQMECPLCNSRNTRILKFIDVEPVIALWREYYRIDIRPEFHDVSQMELWRCVNCSISFFAPERLTGSAQLYSQLENIDWYYLPRKWEYEIALRDLQGRQRILEIGCGSGSFMALAKEEAGLSVEGLELNTKAINDAVQRGLHVRLATAKDAANQSPGWYDAVCSFQVLEHVPEPGEFLRACCTLLRPGGLLILGLPNQQSYVRHMINPLDMPPHHMTRWTRRPLRRLQAHFPLKLVRTACEPLTESQVELYVDTYASILRRRNFGFLIHPWVRARTIRLIRRLGVGRFLRGQNIYACYVRN